MPHLARGGYPHVHAQLLVVPPHCYRSVACCWVCFKVRSDVAEQDGPAGHGPHRKRALHPGEFRVAYVVRQRIQVHEEGRNPHGPRQLHRFRLYVDCACIVVQAEVLPLCIGDELRVVHWVVSHAHCGVRNRQRASNE